MPSEKAKLLASFPQLVPTEFDITSPIDEHYNCIAWAAGDSTMLWWPVSFLSTENPLGGYYWPEGVPLEPTLAAFVRTFRRLGYRECDLGEFEDGFEKVAVYVDADGAPTHAARQLPSGRWTSKLGRGPDIEHASVDDVGGNVNAGYGRVAQFLQRRRRG